MNFSRLFMFERKKDITLIPVGGLANRMRAIASAVELSRICDCRLNVYWFRDMGLNARFGDIFCGMNLDKVNIYEGDFTDKLLYDRPRKYNLWLSEISQKMFFSRCIYEKEVNSYCRDIERFKKLLCNGNLYISSCYPVIDYPESLLSDIFRPIDEIQTEVMARIARMSDCRIGVHIRRTDHTVAINNSPNELFYAAIDEELLHNETLTIYLATDSEEVKAAFADRYGDKVFYSSIRADRNSISGIREAVVEMYMLSMTDKIFGSCGSSYSEIAAALGGITLKVLKI